MKNLKDIIIEKLHINKDIGKHSYNYHPKDKYELKDILEKRLWGKDGDLNANFNDIDVSDITDMAALFFGKFPSNIDISEWDVSNVTDMSNMFYSAENFNCDLSKWDVSNVTNMRYMFRYCKNFKGEGLDKWKPTKCTDFYGMFEDSPLEKNPPKWYKE